MEYDPEKDKALVEEVRKDPLLRAIYNPLLVRVNATLQKNPACRIPTTAEFVASIRTYIEFCHQRELDPTGECYIRPQFDKDTETVRFLYIVAYQTMLRRAETDPHYQGFTVEERHRPETGVLVAVRALVRHQKYPEPIGIWVYRGDFINDRSPFHQRMPNFMLTKTAIATSLRLAFPALLSRLYIEEETSDTPGSAGNPPLKAFTAQSGEQGGLSEAALSLLENPPARVDMAMRLERFFEGIPESERLALLKKHFGDKVTNWKVMRATLTAGQAISETLADQFVNLRTDLESRPTENGGDSTS